jgi:hypothetical protein
MCLLIRIGLRNASLRKRRRMGRADVGEDFVEDCRVGDIGNDPQRAATQRADGHIELERPLQAVCPG